MKFEVCVCEFLYGTTATYCTDSSFLWRSDRDWHLPGYLIFNAVENWSVSAGNDGLIHSLWFCIGLGMGYIAVALELFW